MNIQEVTKIMAILGTEYPKNFEVTPERIKLWHLILEPWEYQEGEAALIKLLSEPRPFPPVVGEINEQIKMIRTIERIRQQRLIEERRDSQIVKTIAAPEVSEEQRQKNVKMLSDLTKDLAAKKALRQ